MSFLLALHSIWRWVVLLAAAVVVAGAAAGRAGRAPAWAARAGLLYTISIDMQVLIGLLLWAGERGWERGLFVGVIHPLAMLGALVVAHAGRSRGKRGASGVALWAYVASLALLVLFIPRSAWRI